MIQITAALIGGFASHESRLSRVRPVVLTGVLTWIATRRIRFGFSYLLSFLVACAHR
jgi:hypothetical protein